MFGADDFGKDGGDRSDEADEMRPDNGDQSGAGDGNRDAGAGGPKGKGIMDGILPDVIKRLFVAGIGAVAVSEEGLRRLATEFSLPKDVAQFMMSQVQTTKSELFRIIAGEIRDFLEHANLGGELQRVLTSLTFEIKMQVRLRPSDDDTVRPQVKGGVKVFRNGKQTEISDDAADSGSGKRGRSKGAKPGGTPKGAEPADDGPVAE